MANKQFKEAIQIAKRLRTENPKLKQTEAVKQAWKEIKKRK